MRCVSQKAFICRDFPSKTGAKTDCPSAAGAATRHFNENEIMKIRAIFGFILKNRESGKISSRKKTYCEAEKRPLQHFLRRLKQHG
jgi:hypothetical protein